MSKPLELIAIGNAIVDIIAPVDDQFLVTHAITKGAMTLIDEARAQAIYAAMPPAKEASGGSAANSIAGFASLGGKAGFIGKVADDTLGKIFTHDMRAGGVVFDTPPLKNGPETARCMILVTPDAQRSMNTFLGASVEFVPEDLDQALIQSAATLYLEGYLYDRPQAKAAYLSAADMAHAANRRVALTLSDAFCVDRHRADFLTIIADRTDVLFANEVEILSLYQTTSFEEAAKAAAKACKLVAITRSEKGSVILSGGDVIEIPALPISKVVDTTGAGDQYAAGFLFGLARNMPLHLCGQLGALAAAEVIGHYGPRPETSLAALAQTHLGLNLAA